MWEIENDFGGMHILDNVSRFQREQRSWRPHVEYSSVYLKKTSSHTTKMLGKVVFPVGPVVYVAHSGSNVSFTDNFTELVTR